LAGCAAFADWLAGTSQRLDAAAERAHRLLATYGGIPLMVSPAYLCLAVVAFTRNDEKAAVQVARALAPQSGQMVAFYPVAVDHLLGLLDHTIGRMDDAIEHPGAGLALCARAGYRPAYGWVAADLGRILLERNADGDHARAIALQNEALTIGRELGMRPLVERVLARREMLTA
jgi:hypothetical protein